MTGANQIAQNIPSDARRYLDDLTPKDSMQFLECLQELGQTICSDFFSSFRSALQSIIVLFIIAVFCSLSSGFHNGGRFDTVVICGTAAILTCAMNDLSGIAIKAKDSLSSISLYSKTLIPVLTSACAAAGNAASAGIRYTAMMFLSDFVITGVCELLLPLTYCCIGIAGADAICGNGLLSHINDTLKSLIVSSLRILLTLYITILGISGIITGSVDAITLKSVKIAFSSVIPVVGGILSDVSETVLIGAGFVKNSVGVFGMLVVVASVLEPVLHLSVLYFVYKITAAFSAISIKTELVKLIDTIGSTFGLMIGMVGSCSVLLLISIFSAIVGGGFG